MNKMILVIGSCLSLAFLINCEDPCWQNTCGKRDLKFSFVDDQGRNIANMLNIAYEDIQLLGTHGGKYYIEESYVFNKDYQWFWVELDAQTESFSLILFDSLKYDFHAQFFAYDSDSKCCYGKETDLQSVIFENDTVAQVKDYVGSSFFGKNTYFLYTGINPINEICADNLIVNTDSMNIISGFFQFQNVILIGDCLNIEVLSNSCESSQFSLYASDTVIFHEDYNLKMRSIAMKMNPTNLCNENISEKFSFDLSGLKSDNSDHEFLLLDGWRHALVYEY